MLGVSTLAAAAVKCFLFTYFSSEFCIAKFNDDKIKKDKAFDRLSLVQSISIVLLAATLTLLSLMMMHRLRYRFHGLYTDYGKQLWKVVIT